MKKLTQKIFSTFMSVALAGGCLTAASAAGTIYGDADNNGKVDSIDALAVLTHSVGQTTLTGSNFIRADVNGDGAVDSLDALDILCFSVGLKDHFDVEQSFSMSDNEILALYSSAVKKARNDRPAYVIERTDDYKDADVTIKDPFGILKAGGSSAAEMEKQMEDEMLAGDSYYRSVCIKGSVSSLENLPASCSLTDASKLKSISAKQLENGNYRIVIKLNDEKNPTAGSTVCKVMGVADYDTTLNDLKESAEIEGAEGLANIKLEELTYKNVWIACDVNPATQELESYDFGMDVYTVSTVGILSVNVKSVITLGTAASFSGFEY